MKKRFWIPILITCLIAVSFVSAAVTAEFQKLEFQRLNGELTSTKKELLSLQLDYASLQQNYSEQQYQIMAAFTPSLETQLGAKILWDSKAGKNYLWMTGEIYNRGYGIAYDAKLQVRIYVANSTQPIIETKNLNNIPPTGFHTIRAAFYEDEKIERWEISVTCSNTKSY